MVGLLVGGCSPTQASKPPPTSPVVFVRDEPPVPGPQLIGKRPEDAPKLWLSVRLSRGRKVYRGWPLLLDVTVAHPDGYPAKQEGRPLPPLRVIPPSGGWASLVKVQLFGPGQRELALPLVQVAHPPGVLVLDAEAYSHTLRWHLGPEETRKLVPGAYSGYVGLESSHGAEEGGWTGSLGSPLVHFTVEDEPSPLPLELAEGKAVLSAQYALYRGNPDEALATLEAHIADHPDSPTALSIQAQMMEDAGQLQRAYELYGAAIEAHLRRYPKAQHPPMSLMNRQAELGRRLNFFP